MSGSGDHSIIIWDTFQNNSYKEMKGHIGTVFSVAISEDNKLIVSGSEDETIKIWNRETAKIIK